MKNIYLGSIIILLLSSFSSCEKLQREKHEIDPCTLPNYICVSNTAELLLAMQNAQSGDTILCKGGEYMQLEATNIRKAGMVTVKAADRGNPPVFRAHNALLLKQLTNFTFDGLRFSGDTLKDALGYPNSRAIRYGFLKNIIIRNCTFDFWHIGIDQFNEANNFNENIVLEYNKCTRRGMDFIRVFRPHNGLIIRNNILENDYIDTVRSRESDRHPDVIQFATSDPCCAASRNVVIERNQFKMADLYSHCMFMLSASVISSGGPVEPKEVFYFDSITVRHNDIIAPHVNTIAFGGMRNLTIEGNRIRKTPGTYHVNDPRGRPRINAYGFCYGTIRNNTGPFSPAAQNSGALSNMTITSDNVWGTNAVPAGWIDPSNDVGPYAYEN